MRYGLCWGVLVCDCSRATWQGLKGKGEQGGVLESKLACWNQMQKAMHSHCCS